MSQGGDPTISVRLTATLDAFTAQMQRAEQVAKTSTNRMMSSQVAAADQVRQRFDKISEVTSAIGKGLAVVNLAMVPIDIASSIISGNFDKMDEAITSLPFGIGRVLGGLKEIVNFSLGVDGELFSESAGEQRRQEGERRAQENARRMSVADRQMQDRRDIELKLENQRASTFEERLKAQTAMILEQNKRRAEDEIAQGVNVEYARQTERLRNEYEINELTSRLGDERTRDELRRGREILDAQQKEHANKLRIQKEAEDQQREAEKRAIEEQISAQKKAIEEQVSAQKQAVDSYKEELSTISRISGADFISSASTALGSFSFGASNGVAAVASAAQRQVELQAQILSATKTIEQLIASRQNMGWN
jgi:hypothetical protein